MLNLKKIFESAGVQIDIGEVSDGFHTFNVYPICIFRKRSALWSRCVIEEIWRRSDNYSRYC